MVLQSGIGKDNSNEGLAEQTWMDSQEMSGGFWSSPH